VTAKSPEVDEPAPAKVEPEPVIEPPKFGAAYLHNPAPDYPSMSRRAREQGRVLLKVTVSTKGDAEDVQLDTSSGFSRLDDAAIDAVKKWQFVPAKRNNQAIRASVLVPVKFSLDIK
jgi:protein TonB